MKKNLQAISLFFVSLLALTIVGCSKQSSRKAPSQEPDTPSVSAPQAPGELSVTGGLENDELFYVLSWIASESDGGREIERHQYRQRIGSEEFGIWIDIPDSGIEGAHEASYKIAQGFTEGSIYTFQVRVSNGEFDSEASNEITLPNGSLFLGDLITNSFLQTLFVYQEGRWSLVCHEGFNSEAANVACRQLGYQKSRTLEGHALPTTTREILSPLTCVGTEERLLDCPETPQTSEGEERNCEGSKVVALLCEEPLPTPTNLRATAGEERQVTLAWTASLPKEGASPLARHQYSEKVGEGEFSLWLDIPNSGPSEEHFESYTMTDLRAGETYAFKVRAVNGEGAYSLASNEVSLTLPSEGGGEPEPGTPAAPTQLRALPGNELVVLIWALGADGGSPIIRHEYYQSSSGGAGTWTEIADSGPTGASRSRFTVAGLTNDTAYSFKLRAVNGEGAGAESAEVSATPSETAIPPPPPEVPEAPTNVFVRTLLPNQVTLLWALGADGGSAIHKHQYKQKFVAAGGSGSYGNWIDIPNSAPGGTNDNTFTIPLLVKGTYFFKLRAVNGVGEGDESSEASGAVSILVGAPRNLALSPGNTQVTLTWSPPASHATSGLAKYQYKYQVSTEGGGSSSSSSSSSATSSSSSSSSSATNSATSSATNSATSSEWIDIPNSASGELNEASYTVTGLTNGVVHTFYLRAVSLHNIMGSATSGVMTTPIGVPTVPINFRAQPGVGEVTLTWATPSSNGGNAITGYQYLQNTESWQNIPNSAPPAGGTRAGANATNYTLTGLTNGEVYAFRLRAVNSQGAGNSTLFPVFVTPDNLPGPPRHFITNADDEEVLLLWSPPLASAGVCQ